MDGGTIYDASYKHFAIASFCLKIDAALGNLKKEPLRATCAAVHKIEIRLTSLLVVVWGK